jgi:hypothetical protein
MKILFNIMSTVSFLGIVAIAGGGAYVYVQKDALIEQAKEAAMEEVTAALPGLLSGALGGGTTDVLPSVSGIGSSSTGSNLLPTPSAPLGLGF